ncbi:MAG: hypothetical protein IJX13_07590 [Clostridia bacterium]|nr:hypothetical protein [Clostridia bacterium]
MKKILSLLLALTMLLTLGLTSCSSPAGEGGGEQGAGIKLEDAVSKPNTVLNQALLNTGNEFFTDETGVDAVASEAMKGGSVSISFSGKTVLEGSGISKITETIYANSTAKKYVADTKIEMEKDAALDDLALRLFIDKDGIALQSENEEMLGINGTYKLNLESFINGFKQSPIKDMAGLDDAMAQETVDTLKEIKAFYDLLFTAPDTYEAEAEGNDVLKALIKTETKEENGSIVITLTINNQTLEAYYEKLADSEQAAEVYDKIMALYATLGAFEGYVGDMPSYEESHDFMINQMNAMTINLTAKFSINAAKGTLTAFDLSGTIAPKEGGESVNMSLSFKATDSAITVEAKASADEESFDIKFSVNKAVKDSTTTYTLALDLTQGGEKITPFKIKYAYTKSSGALALTLDAYNADIDETASMTLKGTVTANKDNAAIEFTSVTAEDVTVNFNLTVAFKKNATMPTVPANAKDLSKMSKAEWEALGESIGNSMLGQMMFAQSAPDDYYGY